MEPTLPTIAFLHPGAMGSALAASCKSLNRLWVDAGRSEDSRRRAADAGLTSVPSLAEVCERADIIVSICPPDAAMDVARDVVEAQFGGIYVDANAIAPDRSREIGELFERYVDGSVIGPPPTTAGTTRLYLSGEPSLTETVAQAWEGSTLDVRAIGVDHGEASALKMAYAGWTKGSAALLIAVAAMAKAEGVADALHAEWELSQPDLPDRLDASARGAAPKAWRFAGEMREIAETMQRADLPAEFHLGAASLYDQLAVFKDRATEAAEVLGQLSNRIETP